MWKTEFKRYFFTKSTVIIILVLILLGIMSFYVSQSDKSEYMHTYSMNYEDIDNEKMGQLIADYNGIKFVLDFILTSDFIDFYVIVLFLFIGIFLTPTIQRMIDTGQENFIISRMSYREHVDTMLIGQSAYLASIIAISMTFIGIIGYIWGGVGSGSTNIGVYSINFPIFILIFILQVILLIVLSILVNGICLLLNVYIKNKFVLMSLPFALFILVPILLGSTLGNLIHTFGEIMLTFIPFSITSTFSDVLTLDGSLTRKLIYAIPFIVYSILFFVIYKINVNKFTRDCL